MRKSYPYPFLDNGDDVNADFSIISTPTSEIRGKEFVVRFGLRISEPVIKEILSAGIAEVTIRWRCQGTLQQGSTILDLTSEFEENSWHEISIETDRIIGTVDFAVLMIASRNITPFRWPSQNEDYDGYTFSIGRGNVTGSAGEFTATLSPAYDPMQGDLDSIFRIEPLKQSGLEFSYDLSGDYIRVLLPNDIAERFQRLKLFPTVQLSLVILPILSLAMSEVFRANESEYANNRWFTSLHRLAQRTQEQDDPLLAAQKLLGSPVVHASKLFLDFLRDEENDE